MKQSAQHNVTWKNSSEECRLAVPSGRTLTYTSFAWKIQILEICWSPLNAETGGQLSLMLSHYSIQM